MKANLQACATAISSLLLASCGAESTVGSTKAISASGYVEIDGQRIILAYPSVSTSPWGWMLSLTDQALPAGCQGAASSLVTKDTGTDFTGIDLAIRLPDRNEPTTAWWFAHPELGPLEGRSLFRESSPVSYESSEISGTFQHSAELNGKTWKIDVQYALPTDRIYAPIPELTGVKGSPAKAFENLMKAWVSGDVAQVRALSTAEVAEQIDDAESMAEEGELKQTLIGFADMVFMQTMAIEEVQQDGDGATITLSGHNEKCRQPRSTASGTVALTRENGDWKVGAMDWQENAGP